MAAGAMSDAPSWRPPRTSSPPHHATHMVTGYDAQGRILVQTWHVGESSMQMEWDVWRERIDRPGDRAARVEMWRLDAPGSSRKSYP
jgi:hypothetical protein